MLLANSSFFSQMMLLGGMIMLTWVLVRRNWNLRRARHAVNRQLRAVELQGQSKPSGLSLPDAPREVMQWQASMFDLQRELKGELDSRILVVESLLRQTDERIEELMKMEQGTRYQAASPSEATENDRFSQISDLSNRGHSSSEIAEILQIPQGEIEVSLSAGLDFAAVNRSS